MRKCVAGVLTVVIGAGLSACSSDAGTEPSTAAATVKVFLQDAGALTDEVGPTC